MDTKYIKYPRTPHLPFSLSVNDDDLILDSATFFDKRNVVVSIKMDGENTTMYKDHIHARSIDSDNHISRDWVKQFWKTFSHEIPEGFRICGENMYAKHSIHYTNLSSYFLGFSIWNDKNICLSWDETLEWFKLFGITPVDVIYRGIYNENKIKSLWDTKEEGFVVRLEDEFKYDDFNKSVAKFVRKNHVQTSKHWKNDKIVPNTLRQKAG